MIFNEELTIAFKMYNVENIMFCIYVCSSQGEYDKDHFNVSL